MHCAFREIERHLNTDIYNALHPNLLILYNMFINNTSDTQEVQVETNVSRFVSDIFVQRTQDLSRKIMGAEDKLSDVKTSRPAQKARSLNDLLEVKRKTSKEKVQANGSKKAQQEAKSRFSANSIKMIGQYRLTKTIGSGSTSKVRLGIHEKTKEKKAIKIVPRVGEEVVKNAKESVEAREARIYREAALLGLLNHPNIVGMSEMVVNDEMFCLMFDYVEGEQLLEHVLANGALKEKQARKIFRQLLSAVLYCHKNSIVHRDLKIENVMLDKEGDVKLIDFGLSNFFDPKEHLKTFCGSLYFAAPELLSGKIYVGPEVDIWSLGIILYVLLVGQVPFDDKNLHNLHNKIKAAKFDVPGYLSNDAKNLIRRMIVADPKSRMKLQDILIHPWVVKDHTESIKDYIPERLPFDSIDPIIAKFLKKEFSKQFPDIDEILMTATKDWCKTRTHPVISLYFLVKEKIGRQRIKRKSSGKEPDLSNLLLMPPPSHYKESSGDEVAELAILRQVGSYQNSSSPLRYQNDSIRPVAGSPNMRKMSLPTSSQPAAMKEEFKIKGIYFKGLFSFNTSPFKDSNELLKSVEKVLKDQQISFNRRSGSIICEFKFNSERYPEAVIFEIFLVKVMLTGTLGLQFRRILGEYKVYKQLTANILAEINRPLH